jgi:hypothetical protein
MATAAVLMNFLAGATGVGAQTVAAPQAGTATATPDNAILLTVFLKHDQSRPLGELNAQLAKQGFYKAFPPAGMEVVSWYVTMGIGQVITLRLPASRIREVNRVLEDTAWGGLSDRILPDLRFQSRRHRRTRESAKGTIRPARSFLPCRCQSIGVRESPRRWARTPIGDQL